MNEPEDIEVLTDIMASLNAMIDASSQMVHHRLNPKWMGFRDYLNIIKKKVENRMSGK